jgi:hypothetical protein
MLLGFFKDFSLPQVRSKKISSLHQVLNLTLLQVVKSIFPLKNSISEYTYLLGNKKFNGHMSQYIV